jgi:hypothetical protein
MFSNVIQLLAKERKENLVYLHYLDKNPGCIANETPEQLAEKINEIDLAIEILKGKS